MKFFLDQEFIEGFRYRDTINGAQPTHFIDLISIGIVAEDGREYYAISSQFDPLEASDWVRDNVLKSVYYELLSKEYPKDWLLNGPGWGSGESYDILKMLIAKYGKTPAAIAQEIFIFTQETGDTSPVKFYGYYADYDWVLFCSLYGTMNELPRIYPMYCIDLKQVMDHMGLNDEWKEKNCPNQKDEHHALADARWNKGLYGALLIEMWRL